MQSIEMTHSEKVEMYRMVEKDKLIEMLIEANNVINRLTEVKNLQRPPVIKSVCSCDNVHSEIETKTNFCGYLLKITKNEYCIL
jgi:hypothetical protein